MELDADDDLTDIDSGGGDKGKSDAESGGSVNNGDDDDRGGDQGGGGDGGVSGGDGGGDKGDADGDGADAEQEGTEAASRPKVLQNEMPALVVTRFLDGIDKGEAPGPRFTKMLKAKPRHPVLKCVLEREPFHPREVMSLARLFLRCCAGCGKEQGDVSLTRCTGCAVAHFCSERCARRAENRHHAAMCARLRELHDALMPSLIKADEKAKRDIAERTPLRRLRWLLWTSFRVAGYIVATFAILWILLVAAKLIMIVAGYTSHHLGDPDSRLSLFPEELPNLFFADEL